MARLLTSLLVVFTTLTETSVGNSLREKRQGWISVSQALARISLVYVSDTCYGIARVAINLKVSKNLFIPT